MATTFSERVPGWFWLVAGLALLWEAMGCASYLMQVSMDAEQLAALPEAERQLMTSVPVWANAAFAIATWGGLAAAIGLLLRRRWSQALFAISLVAVIVQFSWWLLIARAADVMGPSTYAMPVAIIAIGAVLLWFSSMAAKRGWLR